MVELGALVGIVMEDAAGLAESCDDREVVTLISIDTI